MKKLIFLLFDVLLFAGIASAQKAPPDISISHVAVSATFTGFNAGGKMQPANIDTLGVDLTEYVTLGYEHISIPSLSTRYELGLVNFHHTVPKIKGLLFDSSNFVYSVSAGAGKYLSPAGNHWAETASFSLTYPIAGHMGWQVISYQYIHSPVAGVVDKSYQTASTGPIVYF